MSIKVIIADDSRLVRKILTDILEDAEEIAVIDEAENGLEAITLVKEKCPDVLLLDLLMPKLDGIDAMKHILREFPLPIIILSALSPKTLDASIQALFLGAFDYIVKPGGFGAKEMPQFKKELVEKVRYASKSLYGLGLKKKEGKLPNVFKPPRQRVIDDVFQFGKYLNTLEAIEENEVDKDLAVIKDRVKRIKEKAEKTKDEMEKLEDITKKNELETKIKGKPIKSDVIIKKVSKIEKTAGLVKEEPSNQIRQNMEIKQEKARKKVKQEYEPSKKRNQTLYSSEIHPKKELKAIKGEKIAKPKKGISAKGTHGDSEKNKQVKSIITEPKKEYKPKHNKSKIKSRIVVIGTSVGGPSALKTILKNLPKDLACPILIVQHFNKQFIQILIEKLKKECQIDILLAKDGEIIQDGKAYIAPGEHHMVIKLIEGKPTIHLFSGEPVHSCIPSIDVLFKSIAKTYKYNALGILLTGMGDDGVEGLEHIKLEGGKTISESEETCILYGMPRLAAERNIPDLILPNYIIHEYIERFASMGKIS